MSIETLGIDIAKAVFQLHGVNRNGRVILKRRVMRDQLLQVIAQTEPCMIAIEACTGAFYWQRQFEARRPPTPSSPPLETGPSSRTAGPSQPGLAWSRVNIRAASGPCCSASPNVAVST